MDQTLTQSAPQQTQPQGQAVSQSVAVEIYDQIYHLRGIDPAYIEQLARVVDAKMRAVSSHGNTVDSLRVAVLAASTSPTSSKPSANATNPSPEASHSLRSPCAPAPAHSPECSTRSSTTARSANLLAILFDFWRAPGNHQSCFF